MLQDKNNWKNCENCIHTTHWSQVCQLSRSRTDPCDICDYSEDSIIVPSGWEPRLTNEEIIEHTRE